LGTQALTVLSALQAISENPAWGARKIAFLFVRAAPAIKMATFAIARACVGMMMSASFMLAGRGEIPHTVMEMAAASVLGLLRERTALKALVLLAFI